MQSVYLDNTLGFHQGQAGNLEILTQQYDDGKRSLSTISAILFSLGIPKEKVLYAIKHYTKEGQNALEAGCSDETNQYKKNRHNMQFNLNTLAELLAAAKTAIIDVKESSVNTINYSANSSYAIVESLLREVNDLQVVFKKLNEKKDDLDALALVKESIHPAALKSKPEYYLINKSYQLLKQHDSITVVKEYLEKCNLILKENFYTNYISNLIYEMLDLSEHKFYSDVIEDLEYLLSNEEGYIKENLSIMLNKHSWISSIKQLLDINADQTKKLIANENATVERVYSPVQVNEGNYIFTLDNKFYQVNEDKTLQKVEDLSVLDKNFLRVATSLKNYKIEENKVTLYKHDKALNILFEKDELVINDIKVKVGNYEGVKNTLIGSAFFRLDEFNIVDDVLMLIENIGLIKQLDVIDRIIGHNGNIVNIIKLSESNIYINRINPQTLVNELYKAEDSKHAQEIVNEYIKYDISNSVYEILEKEDKRKVEINNQIEIHEKRVTFLNEHIDKVKTENTLLVNDKLNEAIKLLESELRKEEVAVQALYKEKSELN